MEITRPLNLKRWVESNRHLLKPPVGNKVIYEDGDFIIMVVGGPNKRKDYHVDPLEEFFYQLEGDMMLKIIDNGKKVESLTFEGEGCAISLASASIMTELVKGKSFDEVKEIMNAFLDMITNTSKIQSNHLDEDQKTKLMSLSGVKQFPMRVKCATLSWHTLVSAFDNKEEKVKIEN